MSQFEVNLPVRPNAIDSVTLSFTEMTNLPHWILLSVRRLVSCHGKLVQLSKDRDNYAMKNCSIDLLDIGGNPIVSVCGAGGVILR